MEDAVVCWVCNCSGSRLVGIGASSLNGRPLHHKLNSFVPWGSNHLRSKTSFDGCTLQMLESAAFQTNRKRNNPGYQRYWQEKLAIESPAYAPRPSSLLDGKPGCTAGISYRLKRRATLYLLQSGPRG